MQKFYKLISTALLVLLTAGGLSAETTEQDLAQMEAQMATDPAKLMPDHDYSTLEGLMIQNGGRKKPLLTFARESLLTTSGRSKFKIGDGIQVEPMPFIISIWLSGRDWSGQPLILLDYAPVKEALGLSIHTSRFSFQDVIGSESFDRHYQEMEAVRAKDGAEGFNEFQEKLNELVNRLALFRSLQGGAAFTVVPHPTDLTGNWVSIPEGQHYFSGEEWTRLNQTTIHLFAAYHDEPIEKDFAASAEDFLKLQQDLSPEGISMAGKIKAELIYEHFHFFRWAWILCLIASLLLGLTWVKYHRIGFVGAWLISFAALVMLAVGMGLRVYIAERAPVTNMYETVIWVSFGLMIFTLAFELRYKCRYYLISGIPLAGVLLILADSVPVILDPNIAPLTAVLRDNFWLTTHVLTVTISYGAFALAFALGHVVLGAQIIHGGKVKENKFLHAYIYRAVQVGILLLTIGVILGAVWANYSWGRFWGWDPKETWALISILCYLFVLHGRLAGWWKGFGMTVGSVIGFMSVLMCWYGVNYILGAGLHSYGFGTGGTGYVVGFVVAESAFVGLALFRRYQPGKGVKSKKKSEATASVLEQPAES